MDSQKGGSWEFWLCLALSVGDCALAFYLPGSYSSWFCILGACWCLLCALKILSFVPPTDN